MTRPSKRAGGVKKTPTQTPHRPESPTTPLPAYLNTLLVGNGVGLAEKQPYPFTKPSWFDADKFRRGQQFARDHIFSLMFSTGMSVMIGYAYQSSLQPMIYSLNSNNPFKAFKRYLATILYIKSWYDTDLLVPGTTGHRNMKSVRGMHERVKKQMVTSPPEELAKRLTNEGAPMWTDLHDELLKDFAVFPALSVPLRGPDVVHLSQTDMAITQFAFTGFIVGSPELFGIHGVAEEDFEAFVHVWRIFGHLMGIEDRFNICAGDLETVRQRYRDMLALWLKPSLRTVSRDWIHMSRCMMVGLGAAFEGVLMYLCCSVLEMPATNLRAALSVRHKIVYWANVFFFKYVLRVPGMTRLMNFLWLKRLEKLATLSADELKEKEGEVYPYETAGRCPMMG